MSWETACKALKIETGGYLHIHGNVDVNKNEKLYSQKPEWVEWSKHAEAKIKSLLESRDGSIQWSVSTEHIEYVKSYGPRVDHLVLDLLCRPNKNV